MAPTSFTVQASTSDPFPFALPYNLAFILEAKMFILSVETTRTRFAAPYLFPTMYCSDGGFVMPRRGRQLPIAVSARSLPRFGGKAGTSTLFALPFGSQPVSPMFSLEAPLFPLVLWETVSVAIDFDCSRDDAFLLRSSISVGSLSLLSAYPKQ